MRFLSEFYFLNKLISYCFKWESAKRFTVASLISFRNFIILIGTTLRSILISKVVSIFFYFLSNTLILHFFFFLSSRYSVLSRIIHIGDFLHSGILFICRYSTDNNFIKEINTTPVFLLKNIFYLSTLSFLKLSLHLKSLWKY